MTGVTCRKNWQFSLRWNLMAAIYSPMRRIWPLSAIVSAEGAQLRRLLEMTDVAPNSRCIDLGCGVGHSRELVPAEAWVVGVDRSPRMARHAAAAGYRAVVLADIGQLPFATNFDFALCIGVLEYVAAIDLFFRQVAAVLHENGYFLCTISPNTKITALRRRFGPLLYLHRPEQMIQWGEDAGLRLVAQRYYLTQISFLFSKQCAAD